MLSWMQDTNSGDQPHGRYSEREEGGEHASIGSTHCCGAATMPRRPDAGEQRGQASWAADCAQGRWALASYGMHLQACCSAHVRHQAGQQIV